MTKTIRMAMMHLNNTQLRILRAAYENKDDDAREALLAVLIEDLDAESVKDKDGDAND